MKKAALSFIFTLLVFLISCKKEDNSNSGTDQDPDITDNNDIPEDLDPSLFSISEPIFEPIEPGTASNGISVTGSTRNSGNPPAPTTTAGTPELIDAYGETPIRSLNGRTLELNTATGNGTEVQGVYLQVDGADDYIDAPFTTESNQKVLQSFNNVDINLDESLSQGQFCIIYCVYDSQDRVSQPDTVCINIQSIGGNPDLVGSWSFQTQAYYYNGSPFYYLNRGETPKYDYTALYGNLPGYDPSMYEEECESSETLYDARDYTFNADGTATLTIDQTTIYYDDNCSETDRSHSTDELADLFWSYDENSQSLSLLQESNGQFYPASYIYLMNVRLENEKLTLIYSESTTGITGFYEIYEKQ